MAAGKKTGKVSGQISQPEAVVISSATDVGTSRPYLATANTTSEASAAGTGGAVTLAFAVPSGSAAASSFTITTTPSTYSVTTSSSPYTFQGLASGTAYTFNIVANSSVGSSPSTTSSSVTATTVPQAIQTASVTSTVANRDDLTWTAPATGGKAIASYTVTSTDGPSYTGILTTSRQVAETGGTSQSYDIYALNANGTSLAKRVGPVTTFFSPPSFFSPPAFCSYNCPTNYYCVGGSCQFG